MTNITLRKGARVASLPLTPVMAFIDTSDTIMGTEIAQINSRYIRPGQSAEITFKFLPGHVYRGPVSRPCSRPFRRGRCSPPVSR